MTTTTKAQLTWCGAHNTMRGEVWPRIFNLQPAIDAQSSHDREGNPYPNSEAVSVNAVAQRWANHHCDGDTEVGAGYVSVTVGTDEQQFDAELPSAQAAVFVQRALAALHIIDPVAAGAIAAAHVLAHGAAAAA